MELVWFLVYLAEPLLVLAALLYAADGYLAGKGNGGGWGASRFTRAVPVIACGFVIAAYGILTLAFVTDSFWVSEVYSQSSTTLPILYKLAGPWIGGSGSLLFITVLLALVSVLFRTRGSGDGIRSSITTGRILDGYLVFFIIVTLVDSPFKVLTITPPEGLGLNPLLQTPWVLVHPPLIFLSYVCVFLAFALMLSGMVRGTGRSPFAITSLNLSLSAAWLLMTAGIAVGGLWSYRVLGWGGYWAWDPVETASLLPWLALTAYFHLSPGGKGAGAGKYMLMVTYVMVIFATALTRGGFTESVHAFGESPLGYVFLGFAALSVVIFLALERGGIRPLPGSGADTASLPAVSRLLAALSLTALLVVCFLGAAAPVAAGIVSGEPVAIQPEFFTLACYPFTLAFVAALIGCNAALGTRTRAVLIGAVLVIGGIMAITSFPMPDPLADFGLPILLAAGLATGYRALRLPWTGRSPAHSLGTALVHLSLVVILLGVFVSSAAQVESRPVVIAPNSSSDVLGSQIIADTITITPGTGSVIFPSHSLVAPEYSLLAMDVAVVDGGITHHGTLYMYEYLNHGVVSEPLIIPTFQKDIYISMQPTTGSYASLRHALVDEIVPPQDVVIVLKYVPFIWLLWLGIFLMGMGMSVIIAGDLFPKRISGTSQRLP